MGRALVGRAEECRTIRALLDDRSGTSRGLLLVGDPGIGKSTLLDWAEATAGHEGYQVLTCRSGELELDLVFAALSDLVEPLSSGLAALPTIQRRALTDMLLLSETTTLDHRAVCVATLQLFRMTCLRTRLLLVLDDLQWMDEPSRRVLSFVFRRSSRLPVRLVAASREIAPLDIPGLHVTHIGPLGESSIDKLISSRLGRPLRDVQQRRVRQWSAGNPLFALELASLGDSDDGPDGAAPTRVTPKLESLISARISRLPTATRSALLLLACLGNTRHGDPFDVLHAAGLEEHVLAEAVDAKLVRFDDGRVRFTHPLYASCTYWSATARARVVAHRLIADRVADRDLRTRHLAMAASAPEPDLAQALEDGAERAWRHGGPEVAAAMLADSIRLTPADEETDRHRRQIKCADCRLDAGQLQRAAALLTAVDLGRAPATNRAESLHRLARVAAATAGYREAVGLLTRAAADAEGDRPLHVAIERDLANALSQVGEITASVQHAELAAALIGPDDANDELVRSTHGMLVMARFFSGQGVPETELHPGSRDATPFSSGQRHPALQLDALNTAALLRWTDRFDQSRELLVALRAEIRERNEDGLIVPIAFHLGELECWSGHLAQAAALARECNDVALAADQPAFLNMSLYLRALVDSERGSAEPALAAAEESLRISRQARDDRMTIRNLHVIGRTELAVGCPRTARPHLERAWAMQEECGYGDPGIFRIERDLFAARIETGDVAGSAELVDTLRRQADRLSRPSTHADVLHATGIIASLEGDHEVAVAALINAAEAFARIGEWIEAGRTFISLATVQRRQKLKAAVRQSLAEAHRIFVHSGAELWAARATRDVSRIGGRRPFSPLAPMQQAVASLVLAGRSNRQISAELHISVKTVEAHLTRIYRATGVSSRAEFMAASYES